MITNEEKIEIIMNRLNNLEAIIKSYTDNAEMLKDKYSLEDKLKDYNIEKSALLGIFEDLNP
jgi:hypothetical protein